MLFTDDEDFEDSITETTSPSTNHVLNISKEIDLHLDISEPTVTTADDPTVELSSNQGFKGTNKDYDFIFTYRSLALAFNAEEIGSIDDQRWVRGNTYSTKSGDKINFTCRGFPKCPRRMQFILDPDGSDVHVQISSNEHDHPASTSRSKLNRDSKKKVLELINVGVTQPRKVLKELQKNNLPSLTRTQINNLKQREQVKVIGPMTCSLATFLQWVQKREEVPEDEDQVYVVAYKYKLSKSEKIKDLRCFLTTKRLIKQATRSKIIFLIDRERICMLNWSC